MIPKYIDNKCQLLLSQLGLNNSIFLRDKCFNGSQDITLSRAADFSPINYIYIYIYIYI